MRVFLSLALMLGCSAPQYTSGSLRCAPTGKACPEQFFCGADQRCWSIGSGPDMHHDIVSQTRDFAGLDLAGVDLASPGGGDLATTTRPPDMAHPHDLMKPLDMTAIPLVQISPVTTGTSTFTATLPSPSRSGTLLVLTVAFDYGGASMGPNANWKAWTGYGGGGTSNASDGEIWYLPASKNGGGITSVSTSFPMAGNSVGQLSEWTMTDIDQGGWCFSSGFAVSANCPIQPTNPVPTTTHAGDLGITCFSEHIASAGKITHTAGAGWVNLGNNDNVSTTLHYALDYALAIPNATAYSENGTS